MSNAVITIDDFDPMVHYADYTQWSTPDPSQHPTWTNASQETTGVPWHEATYHRTNITNTTASLNFTGTSLSIYGAASSYQIKIDPNSPNPFITQLNGTNDLSKRNILYNTSELNFGQHTVEITYLGDGNGALTLDLIEVGVPIASQGATLTNNTIDDPSSSIQYSGNWTSENGDFFGGTSVFTRGPGNAFAFNFTGSALYIFGDSVDDHGLYNIYINATSPTPWTDSSITPNAIYNGRSGCGGYNDWRKACEKLNVLKFVQGGLPRGEHRVVVANMGVTGDLATYFDFDYMVYTTPSQYYSQSYITNSSCPFTNCAAVSGGNTSTSASPSGSTTISGSASGTSPSGAAATTSKSSGGMEAPLGMASIWAVLGAWMLKKALM